MVQTLVVCGSSILREVAVSVMITSESSANYPTTDILYQAGSPPGRTSTSSSSISPFTRQGLHQAGPPSAPPPGRASISSSTRQGLQHGSSISSSSRQGLHQLLPQAGSPSAPPPGRAFSTAPPSAPSAMDSWSGYKHSWSQQ